MNATELLDLAPLLLPFGLYELRRGVSALAAGAASLARIEALLIGGAAARVAAPAHEEPADELPPDLLAALRAHLARPQTRALAATAAAATATAGATP